MVAARNTVCVWSTLYVNDGSEIQDWLVAMGTSADRSAFALLFQAVAPRIKSFLLRATRGDDALSEELTQEVMLRVWKRAPTYDPNRGPAMAWIYTIARNARIDHSRRRRPQVDDSDPTLVQDPDARPDELAHQNQRAVRLREAVDDLPEEQSHILERAYFEGRSLSEIADASNIPLGTVKSRVRLAMNRLRETLGATT